MRAHTVYWHTNTYIVPLAHTERLVCPWDPYWEVLQGASPFHLYTLCLMLYKALQVSVTCHPEGKVHIS